MIKLSHNYDYYILCYSKICMKKGKIVQVMGPVVDVEFEDNDLPYIKDALEVDNNGKRCVMEVAQHIGNNTVRCIMLAASEGLCKDRAAVSRFRLEIRPWADCLTCSEIHSTEAKALTVRNTG